MNIYRAAGELYLDPQLVAPDCAEEFAALNQVKFVVEARLEQHEATLWVLVGGLLDALAPQVGQVNQSQQQAAPTPAPAPVPQAAVSAAGPPRAPQGQTWQKRWYCSICRAAGVNQTWDRKTLVEINHARGKHAGLVVTAIAAPSRLRNRR